MTETVIPPVQAGTTNSELSFEYDHDQHGVGGFEATSTHAWTFDSRDYHELTDLDIGSDYPYVHQENGHSLRIVTEYDWYHSTFHDEETYTLEMEQWAYRGTTSRKSVYWTRSGSWRLDESLTIGDPQTGRQQYHARETYAKSSSDKSDEDDTIPHFGPYRGLDGETVTSGPSLVRKLHAGVLGLSVAQQFRDILEADSPDDAIPVSEYKRRHKDNAGGAASDSTAISH